MSKMKKRKTFVGCRRFQYKTILLLKIYLQQCVKSTRRFLQAERHWFYQPVSVGISLTSQWGFLAHAFSIRKITPAYFLHIAVDRP